MHFRTLSLIAIALYCTAARAEIAAEPEPAAQVQAEPAKAGNEGPLGDSAEHHDEGEGAFGMAAMEEQLKKLQDALKRFSDNGEFNEKELLDILNIDGLEDQLNSIRDSQDELDSEDSNPSTEGTSERTEL